MPKWIAATALLLLIAGDSTGLRVDEPPEGSYKAATAYCRDGDFETSLAVVHRAARRWKLQPYSEWHWRFRLLEAEVLLEQNQGARIDALLDDQAEMAERFAEVRIKRLSLKARRRMRLSEFAKARELIEEAEKIAIATHRIDLLPEVRVIRGQVLGRELQIQQAEDAFTQAQQLAAQLRDVYWQAAAVTNRGLLRMMRSRCDQAIPLFEQARQISVALSSDRIVVAANNNLGMCYANLGNFDEALQHRAEALRLARPSAQLADVLGEMGTLHLAQGDADKAVQFYRRALDTAKQFGVLPEAARWAGNLASALTTAGDLDNAERALREASSLKPEPRSLIELELRTANIAYRRRNFDEARTIYERTIAAGPEKADVLWQSHAGLARVFRDQGQFEKANKSFEAAIRVIETNRSDLNRTEHKLTFLSSLIKFYQDYVDALMTQNLPIRAFEVVESSRARVLAEQMSRPMDARRAQGEQAFHDAARHSGSILLSYWVAPERSFLWVVTPKEIRHFQLPPAAELSRLVTDYRAFVENAVRDPLRAEVESGRRLYEALILPAREFLPKDARVTIIPDGPLHYLAFDTLPVYGSTPHYWVDDVIASITPSVSLVREAFRKPMLNKEALIIGDPVSASSTYPPLPHAGVEISKVSSRLPGRAHIIRGANAQPSTYRASNPAGFGIIHIAAHAEANRANPLESAVILSPGPEGFRLTARSVADVPLNAEMVMLSACRTSGARAYAGEGLVGLAWAFLHAGSRSVVAGLWDVADESTATMVDHLYAELVNGAPTPEALRDAKVKLRQTSYAKPYYWGPFQCYVQ
jgi:CHAT domain-containing protein/Flp pilus assembly protein TadD